LPIETFDILQTREVRSEKNIFLSPVNNLFNLEEPLYFPITGRESSFSSFSIICRNDGAVAVVPQNILGNLYFNTFREKITPVFKKAIENLLTIRNHLLLQLDLECGNISEEYFDKEEPKYLTETEKISFEKLREEMKVLFGFTNLPLDSEDISEILNCPINDAEKVLKHYLGEV
jgi:hypothetical protein